MDNSILLAVVILAVCGEVLSNSMLRGLRLRAPSLRETQDPYEHQIGNIPYDSIGFYLNSDELFREDRALIKEPQPLCKEIRTEIPASLYVPNVENAEIYTFRPQKIYMVNCSREVAPMEVGTEARTGCWPQHCREKYVDIDIFGKPKTVKENLWQLMMEIPSVPIACECFKIP